MTSDASPQPYAPPVPPSRGAPNRALAFFLSLFAAGAGQLYFGRTRRAIGWLALLVVGTIVWGAVAPALSRAGLLGLAAVPFGLALLARPLSAFDVLAIAPRADGRRPTALVVLVGFGVSLALIVGSALVTRALLVEAFKIPSGSMTPTLLVGDHVFIDKTATALRRGRPIVFRFPENTAQDFVKRVLAIGGDRLEMRDGHPWINGWEVPHCALGRGKLPDDPDPKEGEIFVEYLDGEAYLTFLDASVPPDQGNGSWTVKEDEGFVIGDNRQNSYDSRAWSGGAGSGVPRRLVLGERFAIWLSVSEVDVDLQRVGQELDRPALPRTLWALQPALDRCLAATPPREATVPPSHIP